MVSVIAPIKSVREKIDKICSPIWIYLKRELPQRHNHFYEESKEYFSIDTDKEKIKNNINKILDHLHFSIKKQII